MHRWTVFSFLLSLVLAGYAGQWAGDEATCKPDEEARSVERSLAVPPLRHWYLGEFNGSRYYYYHRSEGNWMAAMHYCRSKDQYLLTLSGLEDLNFVVGALRNIAVPATARFWLAATDFQLENHFVWMYTGSGTNKSLRINLTDKTKKKSCLSLRPTPTATGIFLWDHFCIGRIVSKYRYICQTKIQQ